MRKNVVLQAMNKEDERLNSPSVTILYFKTYINDVEETLDVIILKNRRNTERLRYRSREHANSKLKMIADNKGPH